MFSLKSKLYRSNKLEPPPLISCYNTGPSKNAKFGGVFAVGKLVNGFKFGKK